MNKLKPLLDYYRAQYPVASDYAILASSVKHKHFGKRYLRENFIKLVPKEDYLEEESDDLILHLYQLTVLPGINQYEIYKSTV